MKVSLSVLTVSGFVLVSADRDSNLHYGTFSNPNTKYSHYWASATNVLDDLSMFSLLYVKYGGCAWSLNGEGSNNCGQFSSSDEQWWGNMAECRSSNIAYSLYGTLKTDSSIIKGCRKSTFINSFFTYDGLNSFVDAAKKKVSISDEDYTCEQYSADDDVNDDGRRQRRLSDSGSGDNELYTTLGCSANRKFTVDAFNGDSCHGSNYAQTIDTLDEFNDSLENKFDCVLIYSSWRNLDRATPLLSNSTVCSVFGEYQDFCPDPHGVLMTYEYNFAMAKANPNYKANPKKTHGYFQNDWTDPSDTEVIRKKIGTIFFTLSSIFLVFGAFIRYKRERPLRKQQRNKDMVAA